tara:strand:+ start:29331 stop:29819 length:489 start_codon:yes stop_codon:yes gene_type:complete
MNYVKVFFGVLIVLSASRLVPHPPNFTTLIALSFYVPAIFGVRYLIVVLASFFITDIFLGFHALTIYTWGSVVIIGLVSKYFNQNILFRSTGVFLSALLFFIITNFGVWLSGSYGYSLNGLISCYWLAIPFFGNTILSTIFYSTVIEIVYKFLQYKKKIKLY